MAPITLLRTSVYVVLLLGSILILPTDISAQPRRYARPAPRSVVVRAGYYRPFIYDPWYYPYYPYGWFPPYAYAAPYAPASSVRLQVAPRETEVFVDGYYAGTVDDFDGFLQRLRVEPGEHEITLYLQGYRSARQMIYLQPGGTFRIRHTMETLAPGATQDPRPVSPAQPPRSGTRPPGPGGPRPELGQGVGTLSIRVQPADAEVLIDGERWQGPAADQQLVLEVVTGVHRIEVRREGYRPYSSEVDVRAGETERLNISLSRQ